MEDAYDIRLEKNFKAVFAGPSGSGKTILALNLLKNAEETMVEVPKSLVIFYQMDQPAYEDLKFDYPCRIRMEEGVPEKDTITDIIEKEEKPCVILMDDCGQMLNESIASLFQVGSHHGNLCLSKSFLSEE